MTVRPNNGLDEPESRRANAYASSAPVWNRSSSTATNPTRALGRVPARRPSPSPRLPRRGAAAHADARARGGRLGWDSQILVAPSPQARGRVELMWRELTGPELRNRLRHHEEV